MCEGDNGEVSGLEVDSLFLVGGDKSDTKQVRGEIRGVELRQGHSHLPVASPG